MPLEPYYYRRIVSWIAYHANKGLVWEQIIALNEKRRTPHARKHLEACKTAGFQAVRNADLLRQEISHRQAALMEAREAGLPSPTFPPLRLCDIIGCRFPGRK